MVDIFSTAYMARLIPNLKIPSTWLLDNFFPSVIQFETEEVVFSRDDVRRRLAPFVSPLVAGKVVESRGYTADSFKPAYIKDKRRFDPRRPLKRLADEALMGMEYTIEQRRRLLLAQELQDQVWMLNRRLEWMAAQVLINGSVVIAGDGYPSVTVNFGRNGALTITLTGTARWGQSGATILDNLQDWASLGQQQSGAILSKVIMGTDVWKVFRADPTITDKLKQFWNSSDRINLGAQNDRGGVLMGRVDNFEIWVYQEWYFDDTSQQDLPLWPAGQVVLTGPDMEGTRLFGAILDEAAGSGSDAMPAAQAGVVAAPYFPKSWMTQDPSVRWLMLQSAPLVAPGRPNAAVAASVL